MSLGSTRSLFVATTPSRIQPTQEVPVQPKADASNSKNNTSRSLSPVAFVSTEKIYAAQARNGAVQNGEREKLSFTGMPVCNGAGQTGEREKLPFTSMPVLTLLLMRSGYFDYAMTVQFSMVGRSVWKIISEGDYFRKVLLRLGVPNKYRFRFWCHTLKIHELEMAYKKSDTVATYEVLRGSKDIPFMLDENGWEGAIERDLSRTMPKHEYFASEIGKHCLGRILRSIVLLAPHVSYCQGMNYVCAVLLLCALNDGNGRPADWKPSSPSLIRNYFVAKNEHCREIISIEKDVFWIMIALINNRGMSGIWSPGVKLLKMRTMQFYKLLEKRMPVFSRYFNGLNIDGFFFTSQWYLTLFSYVFMNKLELLLMVWDSFFKHGWTVVYSFSLLLIDAFDEKVFDMNIEEFTRYFRSLKGQHIHSESHGNYDICAYETKLLKLLGDGSLLTNLVSDDELNLLQRRYEEGLIKFHLRSNSIRKSIYARSLLAQVEGPARVDSIKLRKRIEDADADIKRYRASYRSTGRVLATCKAELQDLLEIKSILSAHLSIMINEGNVSKSRPPTPNGAIRAMITKIEKGERRMSNAAARHKKAVWKHTLSHANLEEAVNRKEHFSFQLNEIVKLNEEWRSDTIKNVCQELDLT